MPTPQQVADASYRRAVARQGRTVLVLEGMRDEILQKRNVVGYALGLKRTGGTLTDEVVAVYYVTEKVPAIDLPPADRLPTFVKVGSSRIGTDVQVLHGCQQLLAAIGDPTENRKKTTKMGSSIRSTAAKDESVGAAAGLFGVGTTGALVKKGTEYYVLSAGHVLNVQKADIVQPESGTNRGLVGPVKDFMGQVARIKGTTAAAIDAGMFESTGAVKEILHIGPPATPKVPLPGLRVKKSGRTTGLTFSTVVAVGFKFAADPGYAGAPGLFLVENVCSVKPPNALNNQNVFGTKGDSGSLIVAGWPGDAQDFGAPVQEELKGKTPEVKEKILAGWNHAALGLLLAMGTVEVSTAGGAAQRMSVAIGQEIQLALDALEVTLA